MSIPPNTTATLHVPDRVNAFREAGRTLPVDAGRDDRSLSLGPGRYRFKGNYEAPTS